jgi:hypothetical protein
VAISVGEGSEDAGTAEGEEGVKEGVMVKFEPLEEGTIVGKVSIPLRVGTFGDCEEGGSLRSHVMTCEYSLRGSGQISKPFGIWEGKEEQRREWRAALVRWWSRDRLSATWLSFPANHFGNRTEDWSRRSCAVALATISWRECESDVLSSKLDLWSQPAAVVLSVPVRMTDCGGRPGLVEASKASWM